MSLMTVASKWTLRKQLLLLEELGYGVEAL